MKADMLKTILYMAVSANGLINTDSGSTPWQEATWLRYGKLLERTRCLIVGRRTHDIMSAENEYEKFMINRAIVLTLGKLPSQDNITAASTPQDALHQLTKDGFKEALIGGGAETNAAFLAENLVDEICLDVEPVLFGAGQPLLSPLMDLRLDLKLLEVERYGEDGIGLRYTVIK